MAFIPNANTEYFIQSRFPTGYVLDVNRATNSPGEKIIQWDCHEGNNQKWNIEHTAEPGCFRLQNVNSKLYLTLNDEGKMIQDNLGANKDQVFYCEPGINGGSFVHSKLRPGYVWDIPNSSNDRGLQLHRWGPNQSLAQSFYFAEKVPTRLRLNTVRCESPAGGAFFSTWTGDTADIVVNTVSVGGAGAGLAASVAGVVVTGATATAAVATAGIVLAVVGVGVAAVSAAFFIDKISSSEDDLFIELDGTKIWPEGKDHEGIEGGDSKFVNLQLSENWTKNQNLQLWEHDSSPFFWDGHDKLGGVSFDPRKVLWNTEFTIICGNESEGSVYSLSFTLT